MLLKEIIQVQRILSVLEYMNMSVHAALLGCVELTHRFSWLVASQDPEAEACILPPQEDVLLLEVWH